VKPIIFSTDMVRAILAGRKTMTRRVIKPQIVTHNTADGQVEESLDAYFARNRKDMELLCAVCAPYQPGDILWVRETWFYEMHMHDLTAGEPDLPGGRYSHRYVYRASSPDYPVDVGVGACGWCPSIHMPREAARIFLRVTDVRVERLQEMPLYDVWDEGTPQMPGNVDADGAVGHEDFKYLWDSLNAKRGYGWDKNPFCWVITFERCEKPEGEK